MKYRNNKVAAVVPSLALLFAALSARGAAADSYIGSINGADCYPAAAAREELEYSYGQLPTGEENDESGLWDSVMVFANPLDGTWSIVARPRDVDASALSDGADLLCVVEASDADHPADIRQNPAYIRLLGPKP